jgi:two-component system sensor histidine kinase/response regulator
MDMPSGSSKGNVMIVDDTLPNLRILSRMLTDHGYLVRGLPSGAMALTAVASEPPDLILLDILMPDMDGYEVCQRLKASEQTRDIPVIFMSALDQTVDKVKAFSVGAVDYVTKPFQVEEVLARVDAHLTLQLLKRRLEMQVIELRHANAALQESNAELDAFSHTVAHDLKGPLANILMTVDIVQTVFTSSGKDKEMDAVVGGLGSSARKAINIVDELLLLASVRQENVRQAPLDMADIVEQARRRLSWMIDSYAGEIDLPDSWPVARGYAPWVEEVWVNYVSNGLKYGGRPPQLRFGAQPQPDGTIRFWLHDNGPGIPPDKLETLFTEFTRIERTRAEGHGLGLSIVKRIVTKLGGSVGAESQVGHGSTFRFCLPAAGDTEIHGRVGHAR